MGLKKLLVTNISKEELSQQHWDRLSNIFSEIVFKREDDSDLENELEDTDAIFSKFNPLNADKIEKAPKLKYIGVFATGYGKIDLDLATKKNITVTNVPGYSTQSVAEFTIGAILEYLRELGKARSEASKGNYSEDGFKARELKGKKFGVIGLGKVGSRVAELAAAFGADVSYYSKTKKKTSTANYLELNELVSRNEIISLHIALTPDTENLINSDVIKNIKPNTIVINTSPMEVIDFDSLVDRLSKGDITFIWDHPDEMSKKELTKLTKFDNCITYPPIGYISEEASEAKKDIFIANIESFVKGEKLNVVN